MSESNAGQERRIGFYRAWSSQAAEQALAADHPGAKTRCAHSAGVWALIANALEAGDDGDVEHLTHNLLLLNNGSLVATG